MKRRAFLCTLATTAFAGCTAYAGASDGDETTTDDPGDDTTTRETSGGGTRSKYALDVTLTDPVPVEHVDVDVSATGRFTADHPAELRIEFTNTADHQREFQFGSLVPWDELWGTYQNGDGELLLAPGDSVVPDDPADGQCWRATDGIALPMVMRSEKLDAGETVSATFNVLAAHDSETCHEPGQYRFADDGYLGEGWGFSLEVTSPDDGSE